MAKWKNYRDEKMKEKNEQDLLSEHEKEIALANEHTRLTNENAAMDAARDAAFSSQKAEIDAAASIARSKGHSTEGKIVGMQSISPTGLYLICNLIPEDQGQTAVEIREIQMSRF